MNILEMRGIHKSFFGVSVLRDVSLTVARGEVHALLGENGAGKSTLMNILAGVLPMDAGEVAVDGKPLRHATVRLTEGLGIAFVHQELNLFNDLMVYENLYFTKEITNKAGALKKRDMIRESERLFERLGTHIDPTLPVGSLKASEKQTVEIAKSIFFDARLLILDEPTTALSNDEIEHLFSILNNLKSQGKSFIFISHKMPEIFTIADSYTVLRNGEFIGTGKIKDVTPEALTRMMVGESYSSRSFYVPRKLGGPVLELSKFSGTAFSDVDLTVRKGEILGLTGLQGSGSSEFLWTLFGALPATGGTMHVHNRKIDRNSIHKAMRSQVSLLPPDRKENSSISEVNLLENMYISEHELSGKKQHIFRKREEKRFRDLQQQLSIKANTPYDAITSLSGGNQQKVFIARWLNTESDILLLDNPTQGIDVGAKAEIYRQMLRLAEAGKTIIFNTLELPELVKAADRCAVFFEGRIAVVLGHDEINEHTVMMYATNAVEAGEGVSQ